MYLFKSKFSKITRQNFKMNIYSERESLTLSENEITSKFCRIFYEKFGLKMCSENGDQIYSFCLIVTLYKLYRFNFILVYSGNSVSATRPCP